MLGRGLSLEFARRAGALSASTRTTTARRIMFFLVLLRFSSFFYDFFRFFRVFFQFYSRFFAVIFRAGYPRKGPFSPGTSLASGFLRGDEGGTFEKRFEFFGASGCVCPELKFSGLFEIPLAEPVARGGCSRDATFPPAQRNPIYFAPFPDVFSNAVPSSRATTRRLLGHVSNSTLVECSSLGRVMPGTSFAEGWAYRNGT